MHTRHEHNLHFSFSLLSFNFLSINYRDWSWNQLETITCQTMLNKIVIAQTLVINTWAWTTAFFARLSVVPLGEEKRRGDAHGTPARSGFNPLTAGVAPFPTPWLVPDRLPNPPPCPPPPPPSRQLHLRPLPLPVPSPNPFLLRARVYTRAHLSRQVFVRLFISPINNAGPGLHKGEGRREKRNWRLGGLLRPFK